MAQGASESQDKQGRSCIFQRHGADVEQGGQAAHRNCSQLHSRLLSSTFSLLPPSNPCAGSFSLPFIAQDSWAQPGERLVGDSM